MLDYNENILYDIWLTKIKNIGSVKQNILLDVFHTAKNVYQANIEELSGIRGITEENVNQLIYHHQLDPAKRILEHCYKSGIQIITKSDASYPYLAKNISDMPILLYCKGIIPKQMSGIAIVGSRRCSRTGKEKAVQLAEGLTLKGKNIISGMAKGIDSYAHTACIVNGGYTVAVLGNGLDICYPKEHDLLMKRIEEHGILLSEYEPGVPPSRYTFPRRNRIIAAIAEEIYIPDAGKGSGAYITAKFGEKYGRIVHYG